MKLEHFFEPQGLIEQPNTFENFEGNFKRKYLERVKLSEVP